jgi:preprotein translocase subunit SecG
VCRARAGAARAAKDGNEVEMANVLLVIHLMLAIAMIGAVLLQRSEGGALGIGGGGGGGMGGLLSGRGTANLLTRTTAILAAGFMTTSMLLSILGSETGQPRSIVDELQTTPPAQEEPAKPAVPVQ